MVERFAHSIYPILPFMLILALYKGRLKINELFLRIISKSSYTRSYFDSWIHESVQKSMNLCKNPRICTGICARILEWFWIFKSGRRLNRRVELASETRQVKFIHKGRKLYSRVTELLPCLPHAPDKHICPWNVLGIARTNQGHPRTTYGYWWLSGASLFSPELIGSFLFLICLTLGNPGWPTLIHFHLIQGQSPSRVDLKLINRSDSERVGALPLTNVLMILLFNVMSLTICSV